MSTTTETDYRSGDEWMAAEGRVIRKGEKPSYFMVQPGVDFADAAKVAVFHVSQTAPADEYRSWTRLSPGEYYAARRRSERAAAGDDW